MSREDHRDRRRDEDEDDDGNEDRSERRSRHHRGHRHRHRQVEPRRGFWQANNPNLMVAAVCMCIALLVGMIGITWLGGQRYLADGAISRQVQTETKRCLEAKKIPVVNSERTMFYCVIEVDNIVVLGGK